MYKTDTTFQLMFNATKGNMKSALFFLLIVFYTCQADLSVEEYERKKSKIHYNIPDWLMQDLINSEYPILKKVEAVTHPLLDEIRLEGAIAKATGKDPSHCIHEFTKFVLSSFNDFFNELDNCNLNAVGDVRIPNQKKASPCNQKLLSAFGSVINGAREYFSSCIISTPKTSP